MDKEHRRQCVSEAAWRVLTRDGLASLSVRNVAAEAGLPPSSLRYIFPTQASVREHAVALVLERLRARVDVEQAAEQSPEWARSAILELLPLDAERRMEMEVYLSLGTAAMTDASLRPAHLKTHQGIRTICERAVQAIDAQQSGPKVASRTDLLHALIDGLALHLVRQEPDADKSWALIVLDTQLACLGLPTRGTHKRNSPAPAN